MRLIADDHMMSNGVPIFLSPSLLQLGLLDPSHGLCYVQDLETQFLVDPGP